MEEEHGKPDIPERIPHKKRPVLLSVLCLFSFTYFTFLSLLFFISVLYSGNLNTVRNQYLPGIIYTQHQVLFYFAAGFLLHFTALAGSVFLWFCRKTGFYLLAPSCILLAAFQIFQPQTSMGTTGVYISLALLFALFYKRLH